MDSIEPRIKIRELKNSLTEIIQTETGGKTWGKGWTDDSKIVGKYLTRNY